MRSRTWRAAIMALPHRKVMSDDAVRKSHPHASSESRVIDTSVYTGDKQRCHLYVESNTNEREHRSPIEMVWPSPTLIDTPQSAINLDPRLVRRSESRMSSWCVDDGHPALEGSLLKGTKKSLVAEGENGMYRCGRRHAIDTHTTKNCPRPSDHGYSRGSTTSSVPKPPWKCHT